ncbi:MAG TPA: hypothetical protein VJL89_13405 [Thermodesulfovibrionia bacterium]|nr:hypothetical protein [Thermodesulfovibrionia bacterium]
MKSKRAINISEDILISIDQIIGEPNSSSEFIENILRKYLLERQAKKQQLKDLEIINSNSEYLNKEAKDVLDYQIAL